MRPQAGVAPMNLAIDGSKRGGATEAKRRWPAAKVAEMSAEISGVFMEMHVNTGLLEHRRSLFLLAFVTSKAHEAADRLKP